MKSLKKSEDWAQLRKLFSNSPRPPQLLTPSSQLPTPSPHQTHRHTHACTHACTHTQTHRHTQTHTHTHIYIYIYICILTDYQSVHKSVSRQFYMYLWSRDRTIKLGKRRINLSPNTFSLVPF